MSSIQELVLKHSKKLYNFCLKLTKNRDLAEDLFQDTWVKALKNYGKYNEIYKFDSWLLKICINIYRDQYRKNTLINKVFQKFKDTNIKHSIIEQIQENTPSLDEQIIFKEKEYILKEAISKLDDKYRIPLILFYYNQLSYKEISSILDIKEGTVKSRMNAAKKQLKERLVDYER